MKQLLSDPVNIFMYLAVVYLLGFIGVALLYVLFLAELSGIEEQKIAP